MQGRDDRHTLSSARNQYRRRKHRVQVVNVDYIRTVLLEEPTHLLINADVVDAAPACARRLRIEFSRTLLDFITIRGSCPFCASSRIVASITTGSPPNRFLCSL